jgi:sugar lactone lactonase YvrE
MKIKMIAIATVIVTILLVWPAQAQNYDTNNVMVSTFAGYGIPGYVDGQGLLTAFNDPTLIVSDTASNLYVWDSGNDRIRKITPDRTVSTFVGGGSYLDGYGTNVSLSWGQVSAMAIDHNNQIWLVMAESYYGGVTYLLTIDTNGYVSIANGGLTNLTSSSGICFDSANNLYYSGGNRIYRYNPGTGIVEPFAGSGISGYFDGQGSLFSAFSNPTALACDQADNIYVWDSGNERIRRIDQQENVTTIAGRSYYSETDGIGTNATFSVINSMFFDHAGNLYMVCGSCVRKMDAQTNVDTLAGNFNQYPGGYNNGPGNTALFYSATGGCFSQGMVFVADSNNNRIRNLTFNAQGQPVAPANLQLNTYPGVQITGAIGRTYQIQSSPDMANWNPVAKVLLNSSPYLWIDRNPVAGNKFYRAVMLP